MSKIGRTPISIKNGVTVSVQETSMKISGSKGESVYTLPSSINATVDNNTILLTQQDATGKNDKAIYGLTRANIANIVKGVDSGFEKKLELVGTGFRAQMQGNDLVLSLGFSHPVKFTQTNAVKISVAENVITVSGIDKAAVGLVAANIRKIKPPEPYKGKGIKYKGEYIRRKAGKTAKAVGGGK